MNRVGGTLCVSSFRPLAPAACLASHRPLGVVEDDLTACGAADEQSLTGVVMSWLMR